MPLNHDFVLVSEAAEIKGHHMSSSSYHSPNFGFLAKHDEVLVRHAALAERYVFDDANSSLIKLRQFAELLAEHSAAYAGIAVDQTDSFLNVLDKLWNAGVLGAPVSQLFHGLRKSGNAAVHAHSGDRREALHQLQMARKLAVWFHRSFGGDKKFDAGSFVVPPDPAAAEKDLLDELNRLRELEVAAMNKAADLQATLETELRQKAEAEIAAKLAFDDLDAALELAAESEQQLEVEREKFQQRLAELQAKAAAAPTEQRTATIAVANEQAAHLDLDEEATRHIIDAQLREAGRQAIGTRIHRRPRCTRRRSVQRDGRLYASEQSVQRRTRNHPPRHRRHDVACSGVAGRLIESD